MTEASLRTLLETAERDLATYRNPNVSDAQKRLNELLAAAGLGGTGTDRITCLRVGPEKVFVRAEYSVRSCISDNEYEFPTSLMDEPDPLDSARRWGLERRRRKAVKRIEEARSELERWEAELMEIEGALAA